MLFNVHDTFEPRKVVGKIEAPTAEDAIQRAKKRFLQQSPLVQNPEDFERRKQEHNDLLKSYGPLFQ